MQAEEAIKNRHSVRAFNDKTVAPELIEKIIDCARFAPTARNVQPWEFVVVAKKDTLVKLAALAENGKFLSQCPSCVAIFCRDTKYYLEDGCAATENILISATALGLNTCWIAGDKKDYASSVCRLLSVPEDFKLVSLIAIGYSDVPVQAPAKKPLKEILHWEIF